MKKRVNLLFTTYAGARVKISNGRVKGNGIGRVSANFKRLESVTFFVFVSDISFELCENLTLNRYRVELENSSYT